MSILCAVCLWVIAIRDNTHVQLSILIDARTSVLEAHCVSVDSEEIRIGDVFAHPCFAIGIGDVIMDHQLVFLRECPACPVFCPAGIIRVSD